MAPLTQARTIVSSVRHSTVGGAASGDAGSNPARGIGFLFESSDEVDLTTRRFLRCLSMEKSSASILIVQQADDCCYV
jgi:hypothetical protein